MIQTFTFHTCGLLLAAGSAWLTWCSFWIDPSAVAVEVHLLLTVLFMMAIAYAIASYRTAQQKLQPSVSTVLFWAMVFRVILLPSQPILETDWNRYVWDGYITSQGMNPYKYPPALFLDPQQIKSLSKNERHKIYGIVDEVRQDDHAFGVLQRINNSSVITIYPPFTQMLFMAASLVQPFSLFAWRCVILLFDGLLIYSIIQLLRLWNRNPAMVVFYAWSPLVLKEYINTTHFDGIALSLFFLGVLMVCRKQEALSSILWGASILTKFFTFPLLFFWMNHKCKKEWLILILTLFVMSYPFFLWTESSFAGYAHFSHRWESNSSLISIMEWGYEKLGVPPWNAGIIIAEFADVTFTFDAFLLSKLTGITIVMFLFGYFLFKAHKDSYFNHKQKLKYAFFVIGAILLCSPVANPWYIAWVTPFLCIFPYFSWFYLSVSCMLYYLFFTGERFAYIPWIREAIYIPFFILLASEIFTGKANHSKENAIT